MLTGLELGAWALGPRSIELLASEIRLAKPRRVVEFGSGISTLVIAKCLDEIGFDDSIVISFEQDEAHASGTRQLLRRHGLGSRSVVMHAPLVEAVLAGRSRTRYSFSDSAQLLLEAIPPDFVLIDGPAAGFGGRFGTLPILQPYVRNARFLMDDALRDSELAIAAEWSSLPHIRVDGIRLIEKGILVGSLLHG
jgi:hypothetical protein